MGGSTVVTSILVKWESEAEEESQREDGWKVRNATWLSLKFVEGGHKPRYMVGL